MSLAHAVLTLEALAVWIAVLTLAMKLAFAEHSFVNIAARIHDATFALFQAVLEPANVYISFLLPELDALAIRFLCIFVCLAKEEHFGCFYLS